jgi:sec-independent protein translocase protein TatB
MLDFGFSEILLTSAIALVVLGPEKLPKVARQVGNWMGRARVMARQLTEQLDREVSAEEFLRQQTTAAKKATAASSTSAATGSAATPSAATPSAATDSAAPATEAPPTYATPLAPDTVVPAGGPPPATPTASDAKHPANE